MRPAMIGAPCDTFGHIVSNRTGFVTAPMLAENAVTAFRGASMTGNPMTKTALQAGETMFSAESAGSIQAFTAIQTGRAGESLMSN